MRTQQLKYKHLVLHTKDFFSLDDNVLAVDIQKWVRHYPFITCHKLEDGDAD